MKNKPLRLALLAMFIVAAAWLGWRGYRAVSQARLAVADLRQLQALAENPTPSALPVLRGNLAALETHLSATQSAAGPFLKAAPLLGWLPQIGPTVRDAPSLLTMAIELAGGGRQALDALAPVTDLLEQRGQGDLVARALPAIADAGPQLAAADKRLARAEALRRQVRGPLHPKLAPQMARLDRFLPLIRAGLQGSQAAPTLLGMDSPRTYLVLAQNSDELRATGGFISGVGHVTVDRGRITAIQLGDSYTVDDFRQPHPQPPAALATRMGAELLLLRDSNWSPDFPTSAQVARALYAQDQGIITQGAIALDLEAVRLLVAALGPLEVPGWPEPVSGDNVIAAIRKAWEAPATSQGTVQEATTSDWWLKRKDFMGELVGAAMAKLQGGGSLNPLTLGLALLQMLDERHLQIAVDAPDLAAVLAERAWDGSFSATAGDFLAVVDSNLGYNKANAAIQQQISYRTTVEGAGLVATLTVTYTHTSPALAAGTACVRRSLYGDSYEALVQRCYYDYLRIYAPNGSGLLAAEGLEGAAAGRGEGNTTVFSGDLVVRPGESHAVTVRYRLPTSVPTTPYRVTVRKQAGTLAPSLQVQAGQCIWQTDLSRDRMFECAANP